MKILKHIQSPKVFFSIIFLFVLSAAAASQLLYQTSGVNSFKLFLDDNGTRRAVRTSHSFDLFRKFLPAGGEELFLVSSNKTVTTYLDAEGTGGQVSWSVRKGPKLEKVLWGKTEQATDLFVHEEFPVLVTALAGCCAEMTGYRLYDLETGKLIMSFNDFAWEEKVTQPFSLEIPNSDLRPRFIGLISQDSTRDRDFVAPAPGKQAALLIKYAVETQKQRLQIDMEIAAGSGISVLDVSWEPDTTVPDSDKIEFRGNKITLWNIDGVKDPAQISGVILKITIDAGMGEKTVKIPVKGDKFDLSAAEIPDGVSINAAP